MGKLRTTILQIQIICCSTVIFVVNTYCFNMSDFTHAIINGQNSDAYKEINKISQMTFEQTSQLRYLCLFLVLLDSLIILLCLPILIRLAIQAIRSTLAFITAAIFSLKKLKGKRCQWHGSPYVHR